MTVEVGPPRISGSDQTPATVSSLRLRNRSTILKQIILAKETTRAQLVRDCGLSTSSVTNVTNDLIAEGLVMETGSIASKGGRPIGLIAPRPEGAYVIGADVGERGVAVELFDLTLNLIDREFRGGRSEELPESIGQDLEAAIAALRERNADAWPRLLGVGLGLPGIVETSADGAQTLYAQSLGWPPVPIAELVRSDVALFADNGAKTQAKAELWFGAARGVEHAAVVLLGRGVGLGVVVDGQLQHGATSTATEWGHTKVERHGRLCRCGDHGCLEAYVGADSILGAWSDRGGQFEGTGWRAIGELISAAETGNEAAIEVIDDVIATLGPALGGLVNFTNPQRLVIGGWVGNRLMESFAERIDEAARGNSLKRMAEQFVLVPSTFGGDTVAVGAALMPLEELIREPRSSGS